MILWNFIGSMLAIESLADHLPGSGSDGRTQEDKPSLEASLLCEEVLSNLAGLAPQPNQNPRHAKV